MNAYEASLGMIRNAKKIYEEEKAIKDRLRISFLMTNGKEHTGTSIKEQDGAWILQSGSEKVLLNPMAISSVKMIDN